MMGRGTGRRWASAAAALLCGVLPAPFVTVGVAAAAEDPASADRPGTMYRSRHTADGASHAFLWTP